MYFSLIGKKLVDLVNKNEGRNRTARDFFREVYFPIFYDHPKFMFWVLNSPFTYIEKKNKSSDPKERQDCLEKLFHKASTFKPDASFAVGFGAGKFTDTTSGQISDFKLPINEDDIFYSWIGASLGIGVSEGYVLLIDSPEILLIIYHGWKKYRKLLHETKDLPGLQITAWNGQWLTHALQNDDYDNFLFNPCVLKKGELTIPPITWIGCIFYLAKAIPDKIITSYVYKLGQKNTTIGFIPVKLPIIKREYEIYQLLIGSTDTKLLPAFINLYKTEFKFQEVCSRGSIGIEELTPERIYQAYLSREKVVSKSSVDELEKNYFIHLSWILAMLDDSNFLKISEEIAAFLYSYSIISDNQKNKRENHIENLLSSRTRFEFLENLKVIMEYDTSESDIFSLIPDIIYNKVKDNRIKEFILLINFQYINLRRGKKQ